MDDIGNITLQASYLVCANNLRREAKLCDIILYVQGRMGAMVGYPAHKLLLISASKYFKLLFEREDLRNYCHFPHLSEEGVFAVLDIIYGREIRKETNLDDALMAARFLQVDCAVDALERKKTESLTRAQASPDRSSDKGVKRKADTPHRDSRHEKQRHSSSSSHQADSKQFKNFPARGEEEDSINSPSNYPSAYSEEDSSLSYSGGGGGGNGGYQENTDQSYDVDLANVKREADVDLTADDSDHDLSQLGFGQQGGPSFDGQSFGGMQMDNDGNAIYTGNSGQGDNVYNPGGDMTGMAQQDGSQMPTPDLIRGQNGRFDPEKTQRSLLYESMHTYQKYDANGCRNGKPFECKVCGQSFRGKDSLFKHLVIHTGEKQFACSYCGQLFNRHSAAVRHERKFCHFRPQEIV